MSFPLRYKLYKGKPSLLCSSVSQQMQHSEHSVNIYWMKEWLINIVAHPLAFSLIILGTPLFESSFHICRTRLQDLSWKASLRSFDILRKIPLKIRKLRLNEVKTLLSFWDYEENSALIYFKKCLGHVWNSSFYVDLILSFVYMLQIKTRTF